MRNPETEPLTENVDQILPTLIGRTITTATENQHGVVLIELDDGRVVVFDGIWCQGGDADLGMRLYQTAADLPWWLLPETSDE